jgi:hypothetical protein
MIEMKCPHCDHQLRINSKYAGKRGGCKHCGGVFVVPNAYAPEASPPQDAAPPGGMALDNMEDLPALDPGFARQMADQPVETVEPSTSLEDLKNEPLAEGVAVPLPPPLAARISNEDPLGCVFWGTAFLVPPVGLVWSIMIPAGHPHKARGMAVSAAFSLLAIICVLVSAWLAAQTQAMIDEANEPLEAAPVEYTSVSAEPAESFQTVDAPTHVSQANSLPPRPPPVADAQQDGPGFDNFVIPTYEGLYLEIPQRLTPASLGRALSSYGDYDVRYISIGEGAVAGSVGDVADAFQSQLREQGYKTSTSFGFGTSTGQYRTVKCQGADDEWFFVRVGIGAGEDVHVLVALHAGDSGLAFTLPQYANPQDDPVPVISGVTFAPLEVLNARLLDSIDDALSAFDVRDLVIREAYADVDYEEIAKTYQDYFKAQGWETGMAFGIASVEFRALLAQRDQWSVEIRIENLGERRTRVVAVSPLR